MSAQFGKMLSLHHQMDAYEIVLDWMDEHEAEIVAAGGELPPELLELLEQVQDDTKEKIGRVGLIAHQLDQQAKFAEAESKRLAITGKSYKSKAAGLKLYLQFELGRIRLARVDTALVKVRVQRNSAPSISAKDPEHLPPEFTYQPPPPPPEFDREAAAAFLAAHNLIPDVPTAAKEVYPGVVVELGQHVRIW